MIYKKELEGIFLKEIKCSDPYFKGNYSSNNKTDVFIKVYYIYLFGIKVGISEEIVKNDKN